ncbi:MAG: hypothetical protein QM831_05095 [Kofleriaceae bacterium]
MTLLDQVIANLDDDTVRRVYADSLGDDPYGEFIAVQLELAALGHDQANRLELVKRENMLFSAHSDEWLSAFGLPATVQIYARLPYRPQIHHVGPDMVLVERGFPDALRLRGDALEHANTPTIRTLVVTGVSPRVLGFVTPERFPRVDELYLVSGFPTPITEIALREQLRTLKLANIVADADCLVDLTGLRELVIDQAGLTNLAALERGTWRRDVTALTLKVGNLPPIGNALDVMSVVRAGWPALSSLSLDGRVADEALATLAQVRDVRNLETLVLDRCGPVTAAAFANAEMPRLKRFVIAEPDAGVDEAALRARFGTNFLTQLDLHRTARFA